MQQEYFSNVTDGRLQKNVSGSIAKDLKRYEGKRVKITIEKARVKRSNQQNRFYHGYFLQSQIDCFKERWGEIYTKEQIHDWNKANIWCEEKVDEETGEIFKIPGSSTSQSKMSFEDKLEMCRQFFINKFDWNLPYPNSDLLLDL